MAHYGTNPNSEIDNQAFVRDIRPVFDRFIEWTLEPQTFMLIMIGMAVFAMAIPAMSIATMPVGIIGYTMFRKRAATRSLPFKLPKDAPCLDPNEVDNDGVIKPPEGILFLGNQRRDMFGGKNEEIWFSNSDSRTHLLIFGTTGAGKAQPDDAKVLTPYGWVKMKDICVGDVVTTPDGGKARVVGIDLQGVLDTFRLTLVDGRATEACPDHLWEAEIDGDVGVANTKKLIASMQEGKAVAIPVYYRNGKTRCMVPVSSITHVGKKQSRCLIIDSPEHLYVTDNFIVTHNTQNLLSITFNALCWASGFIYVDGKASKDLPHNIYAMLRRVGREDDFLVLNFLQGGRDIMEMKKSTRRASNTMNPTARGSSGFIMSLLSSMMSEASGDSAGWRDKAEAMMAALIRVVVMLRIKGEILLDPGTIRQYLDLPSLIKLSEREDVRNNPIVYDPLMGYLKNVPGLDLEDYKKTGKLDTDTLLQHGYLTGQFTKLLDVLNDTYGHIFKHQLPDVDMLDVVLNNRILVTLIPSLEKSETESEALGKLLVATLRLMMAITMGGESLEGTYEDVIDTNITQSPSPFTVVFDELGYYFTKGMDTMFAQARGLGFCMIAAGQDKQAMAKGDKNKGPVESVIANTKIKMTMALEDPFDTFDVFAKAAGEATEARAAGFSGQVGTFTTGYQDMMNVTFERRTRLTIQELKALKSGQAVIMYLDRLVRVNVFYVFGKLKPNKKLRFEINRFLKVRRPTFSEIMPFTKRPDLMDPKHAEETRAHEIFELGTEPDYGSEPMPRIALALRQAAQELSAATEQSATERGILLYTRVKHLLAHPEELDDATGSEITMEEVSRQFEPIEPPAKESPTSENLVADVASILEMPFTTENAQNVPHAEAGKEDGDWFANAADMIMGDLSFTDSAVEALRKVEASIGSDAPDNAIDNISKAVTDAVTYDPPPDQAAPKIASKEESLDIFEALEKQLDEF